MIDRVTFLSHLEKSDLELEDLRAAGYTTVGWYFWIETDAHCIGPFVARETAERALESYGESLRFRERYAEARPRMPGVAGLHRWPEEWRYRPPPSKKEES